MKKIIITTLVSMLLTISAKAQITGTVDTMRHRPYMYYYSGRLHVYVMPDRNIQYKPVIIHNMMGRVVQVEYVRGANPVWVPVNLCSGYYVAKIDSLTTPFLHIR